MDFFQNQEDAQKKTGLLVFYYILAVVLIIFGLYAAALFIFRIQIAPELEIEAVKYWYPNLFFAITAITLLIISSGTLYKVKKLSAGGKAVAELLGGKPVEPDSKDPKKRMLLNVVEEMAIASGVQIPRVFILENELGINAFAAGFTPDDAAIGVTAGCLRSLSRDQLQGVIAHEFSHILYGDMRINVKLMGILHGILIIAFLGYAIIRSTFYSGRSSRRSSGKGGSPIPIILFGLALIIVGYIGVFFGNLIKSAISRQREYLADAAAVQFTRNPSGIAGALKEIAGFAKSAQVQCKHAQEASHLFFASNVSGFIATLMSTHPPLAERIKRLDPSFNKDIAATSGQSKINNQTLGFSSTSAKMDVASENIVASVGTTQPEHLSYASKIIKSTPSVLIEAAHNILEAEFVAYALLFSKDPVVKEKQIQLLKERAWSKAFPKSEIIFKETQELAVEYRLPLLDLVISTLKKASPESHIKFKKNIDQLIAADGKVSLFEYTFRTIILRHLRPAFEKPLPPKVDYHSLKPLKTQCSLILSYLAHYGADNQAKKAAFSQAAEKIGIITLSDFLSQDKCSLKDLDKAFGDLDRAAYRLKRKILDACITCVIADGQITIQQAELIRVTADAIGCPIPPLFPGSVNPNQ